MSVPDVAFLGICDRAQVSSDVVPDVQRIDLLGLRQVLLAPLVPNTLAGTFFAFALHDPVTLRPCRIKLVGPDGADVGFFDFSGPVDMIEGEYGSAPPPPTPANVLPASSGSFHIIAPPVEHGWSLVLAAASRDMILQREGIYKLILSRDGAECTIGGVLVMALQFGPLTPEMIAAIKSDPFAARAVRITFGCKQCTGKLQTYAALERDDAKHSQFTWYQDLPTEFLCSCAKSHMSLDHVRRNLHGLLGRRIPSESNVSFTRLYEAGMAAMIGQSFSALLNEAPPEERVQKFLEDNPLLFSQFAPTKLFFKPPLLTRYKADFAFTNSRRDLVFVEIEKPNGLLVTKEGKISGFLEHAFDQVRNWVHLVDDHKLAVLACLNLQPDEVGAVKGIVIAGRDRDYNGELLLKLKRTDFGSRLSFFTYDDLIAYLGSVTRELARG